jgi:hypothetical protein
MFGVVFGALTILKNFAYIWMLVVAIAILGSSVLGNHDYVLFWSDLFAPAFFTCGLAVIATKLARLTQP